MTTPHISSNSTDSRGLSPVLEGEHMLFGRGRDHVSTAGSLQAFPDDHRRRHCCPTPAGSSCYYDHHAVQSCLHRQYYIRFMNRKKVPLSIPDHHLHLPIDGSIGGNHHDSCLFHSSPELLQADPSTENPCHFVTVSFNMTA